MAREKEITLSTPILARDIGAAEHFHQHQGQECIDGVGLLLMFHSLDADQVGKVECRPLLRRLQQMIDGYVRERYLATGTAPTPRQAIDALWGIQSVLERFKAIPMRSETPTATGGSKGTMPMAALWSMLETLVNGDTVH